MANEQLLYQVLDYILNKATTAELEVIGAALQKRTTERRGLGGIDPRGMAERVAKSVQQQLEGVTDVGQIARQVVTDLIRQKEPGMSQQELETLLNTWLPTGRSAAQPRGLSPDELVTRVSQYVADAQGTLAVEERRKLPEDWRDTFWESFPEGVRALIHDHLSGRIDEVSFWQRLVNSLNG